MQAAAHRLPTASRHRRTDKLNTNAHLALVDGTGLLDALPTAAAIIERVDGNLKVAAHNERFVDTVHKSSCTALDWDNAECLREGPISDVLQAFFNGKPGAGELDFKDGDGVSSHFFRL